MAQRMVDLRKLELQKLTNQLDNKQKIYKSSSTQTEKNNDHFIQLINNTNAQFCFLKPYKTNVFSTYNKTLMIDEQIWHRFQQFEKISQIFKNGE